MATRELEILLSLRDEASRQLSAFSGNLKQMEPTFKKMAAIGTVAFAAVSGEIYTAVSAAAEAAKIQAQLNEVLKSTGGIAGITANKANALAQSLKKVTIFDDDLILSGENLLLTFTKIGSDIFPDATRAMLDMSAALGQDLKSSAVQLGKALQDPILGVATLRRVGVNFNETQTEMIKGLVESGHLLEAQKYILHELNAEFGGSANINDFGDRMAKVKEQVEDVQKAIGFALVPALESLMGAIRPALDSVIEWTQANPQLTANLLIAAAAAAAVVAGLGFLGLALIAVTAGVTALASPFVLLGVAIAALIGTLVYFHDRLSAFFQTLDEKTGLVTLFREAWQSIVDTYQQNLAPALQQLSDTTFRDLWIADTSRYMNIAITGAATIGTSSNPKIDLTLNKMNVMDWSRGGGSNEVVTQEVTFKGFYNAADGKASTLILTNLTASY